MINDRVNSSLELFFHISRELANALDLKATLTRVLYLSLDSVGGERGSIIVLDDLGQPVDSAIVYGKQLHSNTTQQLRETLDKGLAGWVVRERQAVLIADTSRDARWLRRPDDFANRSGPKSAICVPLLARERLVGILTLVHSTPNAFTNEHLALMQAISDIAGIAVLNARLYSESQRQARVMTALAENAVTINASLRLDEVLTRILEQTRQAMQVEVVLLALVDLPNKELIYRAATGNLSETIVAKRRPIEAGITGKVIHEGRGLIATGSQLSPADQIPGLDIRLLICAPVHAHGKILGVLQAINPPKNKMDPDALLVLSGIGSLAGTAINNAQLFGELQAAHQRYRDLFEDSIDPILITDLTGKIILANRQAALVTGIEANLIKGKHIQEIHAVKFDKVGENYNLVNKVGTLTYESTMIGKKSPAIPIEANVRKIGFEGQDGLQWILRDITERKELEHTRGDLIAMIYHDLRSPLANVLSSLDILASLTPSDDSSTQSTVLSIATRSTERIQRLVSSLLDIDRLEAGQPVTAQENYKPASLVVEAQEIVKPYADNKRQAIQVELADNLPPVWVDVDMIRRVLINLLENASKYSPNDTRITIGAHLQDQQVLMYVVDNGPGIPLDQQENIFNKYTRIRTQNTSQGIGLGLAFCRLAVAAHGGRIWVESMPGTGSRFYFTLPIPAENPAGRES